jgi:alcohol dehydrogenase YqhD (iron-dependent ADH family)
MKFTFYNPTKVYFGTGEFDRTGELAARMGNKCLLVVGQGSAERLGFLKRAEDMLADAGVEYAIFRGIEPNPHLETCAEAARVAIEQKCDFILALGGGSVMDACKAIAVGFYDPDNLWDYINHGQEDVTPVKQALPIMVIPTLAATGSEMDPGAVITRWETREKCVIWSPALFPKISLIDPALTVSVPLDYTMDGVFDIAVHVMESYFNGDQEAVLQGRLIEGCLLTVFSEGKKLYADPENVKLRENVQWPSSLALSGFFTAGRAGFSPVHQLEHVLSARWDISHGRGLALLMPRWMWYVLPTNPAPFASFARNVMQLPAKGGDLEDAQAGVRALCDWLEGVGLFLTLDDVDIPVGELDAAAEDCLRLYDRGKGVIGGVKPLSRQDVHAIYLMCETSEFMR